MSINHIVLVSSVGNECRECQLLGQHRIDYLKDRFNCEYLICDLATPHILLVLIIADLQKNYTLKKSKFK